MRTGRRPGRHDTRAEILVAARSCFAESGYDRTTMRQIAARAGIDAALVHRRFGGKLDLFLAAVGVPEDLSALLPAVIAGDRAGLGERIVRTFVQLWDSAPLQGASFAGLLRIAMSDPAGATLLRGYLSGRLAEALSRALGISDAERRLALIGSQLMGIGVARYVLRVEPLVSAAPEVVATELGPAVQYILAPEGSPR